MDEMRKSMDGLLHQLHGTNEYNQYCDVLSRVKNDADLYRRIGEFRRGSLWIQMQEGEGFIAKNNELQKEFSDLQENGLAREFFAAEHQYVAMVRELQNQFLQGVQLDISFFSE